MLTVSPDCFDFCSKRLASVSRASTMSTVLAAISFLGADGQPSKMGKNQNYAPRFLTRRRANHPRFHSGSTGYVLGPSE